MVAMGTEPTLGINRDVRGRMTKSRVRYEEKGGERANRKGQGAEERESLK